MTAARWIAMANVLAVFSRVPAASAAPACKPAAHVTGEPDLVAAIEPLLRERGVEVVDAAAVSGGACERVLAEVIRGGTRVMVWITDAEGRRAQRVAEDTVAAATVIESWTRRDLVDPLLASRGLFERARVDGAPRREAAAPPPLPYMLGAGGDVGRSGDGAVWMAARLQGAGTLGTFSVGGILRYGLDLERGGDTMRLGTTRRVFAVTVTGERPLRRARVALYPGLGAGLTAVTATFAPESELEQASAVHLRGSLGGAYRLANDWLVRLDAAVELAPTAREILGEADGLDHQLAASPKWQTWFGIALMYGGL